MPAAWVGAAAAIGGSLIGSNATSNAADTQAASTAAGIAEQQRQFDLTRSDYAPFRAAGTQALGQLQTDINTPVTSADVMSDPGYQFGLDQGTTALNRRIAASGGRISGAALKAASRFGTDYASTGYGAAYQRREDRLNRLAALAGIGQTSTAGSAAAGSSSANAISGLLSSQGDASGAAQIAQGNIWANTGNQLAAIYQRQSQVPQTYAGFNGNQNTGYTYQNPQDVGPFQD